MRYTSLRFAREKLCEMSQCIRNDTFNPIQKLDGLDNVKRVERNARRWEKTWKRENA